MASFRFTLNTKRLDSLSSAAHAALQEHLERSAQELLATSQDEAPVDTGTLRASGFQEETGALSRQVAYTAEYALYVHEGTVDRAANPWLARAAEAMRSRFVDGAEEAVRKAAGR